MYTHGEMIVCLKAKACFACTRKASLYGLPLRRIMSERAAHSHGSWKDEPGWQSRAVPACLRLELTALQPDSMVGRFLCSVPSSDRWL